MVVRGKPRPFRRRGDRGGPVGLWLKRRQIAMAFVAKRQPGTDGVETWMKAKRQRIQLDVRVQAVLKRVNQSMAECIGRKRYACGRNDPNRNQHTDRDDDRNHPRENGSIDEDPAEHG